MQAERALDALVGASAKPNTENVETGRPLGFLEEALSAFGFGSNRSAPSAASGLGGTLGQGTGGGLDDRLSEWASRAQAAMGRNPGLTAGGVLAGAGLLLGSGRARGLLGGVAGIGGLALIAALAYKAFRKTQEKPGAVGSAAGQVTALDPAKATDADAHLFARAMVAAIAADGHIDDAERARVGEGLRQAGLDSESANWLDREFTRPASPEALAAEAFSPAKAAQVYAAARLAVEPDTSEERAFLDRLAGALNLDPKLRDEIDRGASDLKIAA